MKNTFFLFSIIILSMSFSGCPTTKEVKKGEQPPPAPVVKKPAVPELTVTVASLNLAKFSKRIEKKDIEELAEILKKEDVEVLTMQGISRYPGVATRIDIIDELARQAEMRNVFGETITLSGKQTGNTIFSLFPIISNENTHYDGIHSTNFEAAMQAVLDCGTREIVFVSTNLPDKLSLEDQTTCVYKLSSLSTTYINHPLIILGNMPKNDAMRAVASYESVMPSQDEDTPRIWFSNDGSLKPLHNSVKRTPLGSMIVVQFGMLRK